ncbi:hypothetical protein [Tranquillimonas alkanivorans]|uniref:Uncharacterized protein n=1 Tax=Tranquillimonas alkanivorans TaxID=441119 RepID=A0A1I5R085_9RHOB|nr:hypothetical protein [Tranquillimonas alkanivorans]SFP51928.1 hypothetical protein SAMN04488047_107207 [Tranquillimonas alkanivorans]
MEEKVQHKEKVGKPDGTLAKGPNYPKEEAEQRELIKRLKPALPLILKFAKKAKSYADRVATETRKKLEVYARMQLDMVREAWAEINHERAKLGLDPIGTMEKVHEFEDAWFEDGKMSPKDEQRLKETGGIQERPLPKNEWTKIRREKVLIPSR